MIIRSVFATLLLLASSALAADVIINSFECDDSLPITATDASLDCYPHDGYCMLGQDVTIKAKSESLRCDVFIVCSNDQRINYYCA